MNTPDSQTGNRPLPGKKKKVIGPGRQRSQGDDLPPVAPSTGSRREDIPQHKGPPVGTPRPQPLVAQWAITSPTPQYPTEKLTTITSDNENDNDHEKEKSKSTKRDSTSHPKHSNGHLSRESSERQKTSSRLSNHTDENEESDGMSKKTSAKHRHNRNHEDNDDDSDRQKQPSVRKSTSNHNSTHRSHSKSNGFGDDDE